MRSHVEAILTEATDDGYVDPHFIYPRAHPPLSDELKAISQRHETMNKLIKTWKVLDTPFRLQNDVFKGTVFMRWQALFNFWFPSTNWRSISWTMGQLMSLGRKPYLDCCFSFYMTPLFVRWFVVCHFRSTCADSRFLFGSIGILVPFCL